MIGKITGTLIFKNMEHILIDVHGLSFEVFLSEATLAKLPTIGEKISMHTELVVREDLLQLIGFTTRYEREWYRTLTGVQGVGSKAALKILSTFQVNSLSRHILTGDFNAIKATPGIGPKIAQRIVSELKDKVPSLMAMSSDSTFENRIVKSDPLLVRDVGSDNSDHRLPDLHEADGQLQNISSKVQAEALSALINLGYASHDAALSVSDVLKDQERGIEVQEVIRLALRNLSRKNG